LNNAYVQASSFQRVFTLFRFLFPTFEKPVERPHYVDLQPETHEFRAVGVVLLLAASCGVALALWEPSHQVTTPFATASAPRSAPATAGSAATPETTAAADVEDEQVAPTVKLSTLCSQRATARRDCASVKALKDARMQPVADPAPAATKETKPAVAETKPAVVEPKPAVTETKPAVVAAKPALAELKPALAETKPAVAETKPVVADTKPAVVEQKPVVASKPAAEPKPAAATAKAPNPDQDVTAPAAAQRVSAVTPPETPAVTQPAAPVAQPQKTASAPKAKRQRGVPEDVVRAVREAPVERLVKVYEQVMPDGRRVPVYRRAGSGGYETGTIVDGEYRPARRAEARFFGLQ
jgi:hypothetical protein